MKIFHPETFQGSLKKKNYFEGWYYKTVFKKNVFAIIPGISLGDDPHSFIQIINGSLHKTDYLRFPVTDFNCTTGELDVRIGSSHFLRDRIILDIERKHLTLKGELHFSELTPYRTKALWPGIMGPYSFVPYMECYHGIVSVDHKVNGQLSWNDTVLKISEGRGYIEKDWGRSMPSAWIWIQSNIFDSPGTSLMLSIARIPWLGRSFNGCLAYFHHKNIFYSFTTYNNSSYEITENEEGILTIRLKNRHLQLLLSIPLSTEGGKLAAPVDGNMERTVREKTDSEVTIELKEKNGRLIYEGTGSFCGFELTGDINTLQKKTAVLT